MLITKAGCLAVWDSYVTSHFTWDYNSVATEPKISISARNSTFWESHKSSEAESCCLVSVSIAYCEQVLQTNLFIRVICCSVLYLAFGSPTPVNNQSVLLERNLWIRCLRWATLCLCLDASSICLIVFLCIVQELATWKLGLIAFGIILMFGIPCCFNLNIVKSCIYCISLSNSDPGQFGDA